jgi:hypothetical protein
VAKICSTPGCGKPKLAKGLCTSCYGKKAYQDNPEHKRKVKRAWVEKNREKVARLKRDASLRRNYGIGLGVYEALLQAQRGMCAICLSTHSKRPKMPNLVVDHDHETGRVRGLLCAPCNAALGMLSESPVVLMNAIDYLRRSQ